jgi:hypothetical protein
MPPSFDPSKPLAAIRALASRRPLQRYLAMSGSAPTRTLLLWFVGLPAVGLLATFGSCGPPEHRSIPGPILVPANDEFIGAHPSLVEISAIGGTVYVRDGGIAICFGAHMLPPSREDERIVVIEGRDRCGRSLDDRDISLLCQVPGLAYLDLCAVEVSQASVDRLRKCHPSCRIRSASDDGRDGRRRLPSEVR